MNAADEQVCQEYLDSQSNPALLAMERAGDLQKSAREKRNFSIIEELLSAIAQEHGRPTPSEVAINAMKNAIRAIGDLQAKNDKLKKYLQAHEVKYVS